MHVCRTKAPDGLSHPGKAWKGNCYIGFGGKGIKAAAFEVLTPAAQGSSNAAPPAPPTAPSASPPAPVVSWVKGVQPNAVVGGNAGGTPIHVCRAPVPNKEMHPGKEWKGNCYVEFGG